MRILVVEDERRIASSLQEALEEEGHVVDLAYDGDTGLNAFSRQAYDMLILDWALPDRDGLDICRSVRRTNARIPIMMLTVRNAVADRVAGLRNGADDYLTKPFSFAELLARVDALGRRAAPAQDRTLSAADLKLDPESRSVWRGGQIVFLSSREYSLLYYLLTQKGRIISRDELVVRAWDLPVDHFGSANLVDVHIRNLRKKLGRGTAGLVRTVRGLGYCLDDESGCQGVS